MCVLPVIGLPTLSALSETSMSSEHHVSPMTPGNAFTSHSPMLFCAPLHSELMVCSSGCARHFCRFATDSLPHLHLCYTQQCRQRVDVRPPFFQPHVGRHDLSLAPRVAWCPLSHPPEALLLPREQQAPTTAAPLALRLSHAHTQAPVMFTSIPTTTYSNMPWSHPESWPSSSHIFQKEKIKTLRSRACTFARHRCRCCHHPCAS